MALRRLASVARLGGALLSRPLVQLPAMQPLRTLFVSRPVYSLAKVLDAEIKDEQENGVPPTFEAEFHDFKIEQTVASATLTKQMKDETIKITLNLNDCECIDNSDEMDDSGDAASSDDDEASAQVIVPTFTVEVTKKAKDEVLLFECTIESLELTIHRVGVRSKGAEEKDTYFTTCSFFGEELYEGFAAYLEKKGLDQDFVEFFDGFVADKEYGEYLKFLKNARKFIGKE